MKGQPSRNGEKKIWNNTVLYAKIVAIEWDFFLGSTFLCLAYASAETQQSSTKHIRHSVHIGLIVNYAIG